MACALARALTADAGGIARLIEAAFARDIAPGMSSAGRVAFRLYVTEKALRLRLAQGALAWCAWHQSDADPGLAGYIELRGRGGRVDGLDHLSLLFVAAEHRGRGLARRLLEVALEELRRTKPPVRELSVHAAPAAVPAYRRLGFVPDEIGDSFAGKPGMPQPMRLVLAADAGA